MSLIAGAAIVIMMLLSTADVLLRLCGPLFSKLEWWFFSFLKPIPGTYELVSFLGTVAAAFAMAHTSLKGGHVSVSLVTRLLPERARNTIRVDMGTSFSRAPPRRGDVRGNSVTIAEGAGEVKRTGPGGQAIFSRFHRPRRNQRA